MVSHNANLAAHYTAGRTIKPMLPAALLCITHTIPMCIPIEHIGFPDIACLNGYTLHRLRRAACMPGKLKLHSMYMCTCNEECFCNVVTIHIHAYIAYTQHKKYSG